MLLEIKDDFDLRKIALSGQCFRVKRFEDGTYRFVTGDSAVYIKDMGDRRFSVSSDMDSPAGSVGDACHVHHFTEKKHPCHSLGCGDDFNAVRTLHTDRTGNAKVFPDPTGTGSDIKRRPGKMQTGVQGILCP